MATPYTAEVKIAGKDGWAYPYHITSSDVAGEFWVFQDGSGDIVLPTVHSMLSVFDIIVSSSGGTTKNAEVFVNGVSTGINVNLSANLATNLSRQLSGAPINLQPGAKLKIIQRA